MNFYEMMNLIRSIGVGIITLLKNKIEGNGK
ncbi:MAG: hypothetical protein C5S38_04570 [Candidatus Methanophagaceae archaeon]|nr:MAG: hypothetical protein C5S38_04570 [Methanophagales archaeon]